MNNLLLIALIAGYIPAIFCALGKITAPTLLYYYVFRISSWTYLLFATLFILKNYQLI